MQVLYSMSRDPDLSKKEALRQYRESINRSFELYLFNLWQLVRAAAYAKEDAEKKTSKHLPTEADKRFTAKLWENGSVQSLMRHNQFRGLVSSLQLDSKLDQDITRKLYAEFSTHPEYLEYLDEQEDSEEKDNQVLLNLYKTCMNSELFLDLMEDHFPAWIDDRSLLIGSMKKTIKALPATDDFLDAYKPTEETFKEFGEVLLDQVISKDEELLGWIEPTLKNWDAERVAVVDMILLKMALCELTGFPTIPTKVTLNEFVEISKLYSTDKSKDFINGILDRLLKKLHKEGKINKEGRGLIE